jgi:hypothetical protein
MPSKVKSALVTEIQSFYGDLLLEKLRIVRPSKFIVLCGGAIVKTPPNARPENLRDYLWRVRPLRLSHPTVLAEDAVQLFRDSDYGDLISFEEDVARIAAVVLVIAESAGSLAELGAFASNDTIRQVLRVVIQEEHEKAESFVRFGPILRISKAKRDNLGVYPWRLKNGKACRRIHQSSLLADQKVYQPSHRGYAIKHSVHESRRGEAILPDLLGHIHMPGNIAGQSAELRQTRLRTH